MHAWIDEQFPSCLFRGRVKDGLMDSYSRSGNNEAIKMLLVILSIVVVFVRIMHFFGTCSFSLETPKHSSSTVDRNIDGGV